MRALLIVTLALASNFFMAPGLAATPAIATHVAASQPTIHTHAELDRYLQTTPADQSPLSLLPVGARKRFLGTLVWGEQGLGGFDPSILPTYLTDAQIVRVLALFDAQSYASLMHGRATPLSEAARGAPESTLEHKFDQWFFAETDAKHGVKQSVDAAALYDRLLAPYQQSPALRKLDDSDMFLLFRAAMSVSFASHDARHLDVLRLDLAELHRRGLATAVQVSQVHDQLVAARHFDDANALADEYPAAGIASLPPLQQATDMHAGAPTVLTVRPNGEAILRKAVDMRAALRIVVVAGCHFSEDAARAIRADPRLDKLFREHAIWLADQNESLPAVLQWNREFPDQTMHVAWRNDEWSMLDSWDIPTFYVFRNGKLLDQWSGWPGDTGMQSLRAHLERAGVLH